jgi:hypothetical protein
MSSDAGSQTPPAEPVTGRSKKKPRQMRQPAAVYIDYENAYLSLSRLDDPVPTFASPSAIMRAVHRILMSRQLQPRMRRSYANWSLPCIVQSDSQNIIGSLGYVPIHSIGKAGSNSADITLICDMIAEMSQHSNLYECCVIVSGDNDIAPALRKLKELGVSWILVIYPTDKCLGSALRAEADECIPLDYLYGQSAKITPLTNNDQTEPSDEA